MNVTFTTSTGTTETHKALRYAFPKKGNAPEGFHLFNAQGDVKLQAATTGGGKYPKYTYFIVDGVSYYLPKNVNPENGTTLHFTVPEVAKPAADAVLADEVTDGSDAMKAPKAPRSRKEKAKAE